MLNLESAIKHCEEVAEKNERRAESVRNRPISSADFYHEEESCSKCAEEHRQLVSWLRELKQLREQTRWIPVSERLPNDHEYIKNNGLFNVSDGNRSYFGWFDINTKKFVKPTIAGFRVDNAVIAWMPLPEPYGGERDE